MAQWLTLLASLPEDPNLVASTYTEQFTNAYNSGSGASYIFFRPLQAPQIHIHARIYKS